MATLNSTYYDEIKGSGKMKILITSRKKIEQMTEVSLGKNVALISICDTDLAFAKPSFKPVATLQVRFNDVYFDDLVKPATKEELLKLETKYCMITDDIAKRIAEFYYGLPADIDMLICQCEYGQSRSAAVGAAILEFKSKKGIDIFSNDKYCPNKLVFRKVLKALKNLAVEKG